MKSILAPSANKKLKQLVTTKAKTLSQKTIKENNIVEIEKQREKILKIAHKFTPIQEYNTIANVDAKISKLTIVWGAKESLYKIYGKKKLLFLHHIYIEDFSFDDAKTTGEIRFNGEQNSYDVEFLEFEGFTCVYAY